MNSIEKIDFSSFLACNILPVYSSYVTVPVNVYGQLLVFLSDLAVVCTLLYWQIKMMIMMTAMTYKRYCSYVATSCMHPGCVRCCRSHTQSALDARCSSLRMHRDAAGGQTSTEAVEVNYCISLIF